MGKRYEEKIEELISLLKKLIYEKSKLYRPRSYRPRMRLRLTNPYVQRRMRYVTREHESKRSEKQASYVIRVRSEPEYRPRERLVYDPDVKKLLEKIERNVSDFKEEVESILNELENPEVHERLLEILEVSPEEPTELQDSENQDEKSETMEKTEYGLKSEFFDEKIQELDSEIPFLEDLEIIESDVESYPIEAYSETEELEPEIDELELDDLTTLETELFPQETEEVEVLEEVA